MKTIFFDGDRLEKREMTREQTDHVILTCFDKNQCKVSLKTVGTSISQAEMRRTKCKSDDLPIPVAFDAGPIAFRIATEPAY